MIVGCLREAGEFDVFVDQFDAAMTRAAIEAGMSVCVVDGPRAERIKPIIDAAVAHFYMMHKMRSNWPMLGGRWKNAR